MYGDKSVKGFTFYFVFFQKCGTKAGLPTEKVVIASCGELI